MEFSCGDEMKDNSEDNQPDELAQTNNEPSTEVDDTFEIVNSEATGEQEKKNKPVPLCMSSTHVAESYYPNSKDGADKEVRRKLTLCEEGLELFRTIGDDHLIPICVTGPARTGKSTFLSLLQNGVKFEVGHTTESQTMGIWCGLGNMVEINGKKAHMVLVDTEGIRSVSAEHEQVTHHTWDSKILSLSLLISSFFVYNNSKTPTTEDINQLEFLSNFVTTVKSNSHVKDQKRTSETETDSPHFIWLIRDASLTPVVGKKKTDWNTFVNKLLTLNETRKQTAHIGVAIREVFQSVTAFGIPCPSLEEEIVEKLMDYAGSKKINEKFSTAIANVIKFIHGKNKLKQHGGLTLTGNMMAELIPHFVKAINEESEKIPVNNMWENFIRTQLKKKQEEVFARLQNSVKLIGLPTSEDNLEDKFRLLRNQVEPAFAMFNERIRSEYVKKVKADLNRELDNVKNCNVSESESLCSKVISSLMKEYFHPLRTKQLDIDYSEFVKASGEIIYRYEIEAKGPKKPDLQKELVEQLEREEVLILKTICDSILKALKTAISTFVRTKEKNAPYEEQEVRREWGIYKEFIKEELSAKIENLPREVAHLLKRNINDFFERQYEKLCEHNENVSHEQCTNLMETLIEEELRRNIGYMFFNFDDVENIINTRYNKEAIGPGRGNVLRMHEEKIHSLVKEGKTRAKQYKTYLYSGTCFAAGLGAAIVSTPVAVTAGLGGVAVFAIRKFF